MRTAVDPSGRRSPRGCPPRRRRGAGRGAGGRRGARAHGAPRPRGGEELVARPRDRRPDGVFAANDLLAVGLLQALSLMADVRVPGDIALIGYDDIDFAAATVVPLSSIRQPAHLIGYTAVDLLLRHLQAPADEQERNVRFQPELVVRASTAG
ncbi:substrate-binding domain-containing protein [Microbacterium sp. 4R-513]|uniref:substrate-binding domain-containing protein n=1 Tax=Microbacterium sp. 4R-513 TaxID=2567934 RepID=UPI001F497878|nr:substrate-binding domain-containing protein [Microbacterium sp. 4R-513]